MKEVGMPGQINGSEGCPKCGGWVVWVEVYLTPLISMFINACRVFIKADELDRKVLFFLCGERRIKSNLRRLFDRISINPCANRWYRYAFNPVSFGESKDGFVAMG